MRERMTIIKSLVWLCKWDMCCRSGSDRQSRPPPRSPLGTFRAAAASNLLHYLRRRRGAPSAIHCHVLALCQPCRPGVATACLRRHLLQNRPL